MTEEEIAALKAQADKAAADLAAAQTQLSGLVEEVKDLRGKKQEVEGERDALKLKIGNVPPKAESTDVEAAVKKVLEQESVKTAEEAKLSAERRFKNEHKEFDETNDPGGLKYAAFQDKLKMFNISGLKKETEFLEVFENGLTLMKEKKDSKTRIPYSDTGTGGSAPKETHTSTLSSQEQKLIVDMGWTEERLTKVKAKHGQRYIDSLLKHAQN
jgi:chromosome segregation ATPase